MKSRNGKMKFESVLNIKVKTILVSLLIVSIVLALCVCILTFGVPEKYRIEYSCQNCSIGKVEVAGDYICHNRGLNPLSFNCRDQAIKDCVAFNDYQKIMGSDERCVV